MLRLFTSNRMEILAGALSEVLRTPLASPLDEEIVVVQSRGMERWVSTELARHHGVCANVRFPFPNAFVYEVFQKVLQDQAERSTFDPRIMTWRIMGILPSCLQLQGFDSLRNYVKDSNEDLRLFQLSEHIAEIFDQYLLFRPEMILDWEKQKEDHWQAVLWRELVKGDHTGHPAKLGKAFLETVEKSSAAIEGLPERISVFGISALPRFHMQILVALSRFAQVNLFLMNPCREYWADIVSDREMKRTLDKESADEVVPEDLHLEKGNSLLASMGALGRDFFDLMNEFDCDEIPDFHDPGDNSLLSSIQSDILNLRNRGQGSDEKRIVLQDDTSIQIHSCHSPMREMEVLYDRLLDLFEKDPSLLPKDVLVMAPDIETYAPYVQAVFDLPDDDSKRFPFSIADRSARKESRIIDAFMSILDLCGSRFGASQVLAVLESQAAQRRFGLSGEDLGLIRRWVSDTRIRWGIDQKGRAELGLPAFAENTWRAGLERLLLGYAMPGRDERMFGGVLPYDYMEGSEALVLGKFLEFADRLFTKATALGQPRTLGAWSKALTEILEGFFLADEDTEREMQMMRRAVAEFGHIERMSGFSEEIDIRIIKTHLGNSLEKEGFGFGFIAGGVTFCAMLPMRSVPFKVICLVGMNDDIYPRQSRPLGFDLMARHPRPGDRSRRRDDRYLFLEAVVSAREKLYISFTGQSARDNTAIQPSVLVSELVDYIKQGFETRSSEIPDHVITRHRLQAFSPEYFKKNEKLFSYSGANCRAAECVLKDRKDPAAFISKGLSGPEDEWRRVSLDQLCSFFSNPAKYLLNRRLGIYLEEKAPVLEERESFDVVQLEKYLLEQRMVETRFSGRRLEEYLPVARAAGLLPHGAVGECIFENLSCGVNKFVEMTGPYMQGPRLDPLDVDLSISGFNVTGRIDAVYQDRLLLYRYAKVKPRDRIRAWIHHLALNCLNAWDCPRTTMLVGLHGPEWTALEYSAVQESKEILERLIETYWIGLVRPVHFFPESSWEYAQMVLERNRPEEKALEKARSAWEGSDHHRGESVDPYYRLCFRDTDPIDSEFQQAATIIFEPLLRSQRGLT